MSETDLERLRKWDRKALTTSPDGWSIGVAQDILAIEARLAALEESSRAVQSPEETTADVANDPARESNPQTLPPRETWPPHLRPRDEATTVPATDDGPGDGYRWVNTGEALEADDELLRRGNGWGATLLAGIGCGQPNTYRRRITPDAAVDPIVAAGARLRKSFPDDAGRRLVAGEPMTAAEMMHALTVAREEIARLTAERDAAKQRFREYEHMVMTGRSEQHDRLVAERDEAKAEVTRLKSCHADAILVGNRMVYAMHAQRDEALRDVEKHRMTADERKAFESASWPFGTFPRMNPLRSAYLDRTREEE